MKEQKIIHIDTQTLWSKKHSQVLELIKRLNKRGVENILACRPSSEISKRAAEAGIAVKHFSFRGEWDIVSAFKLRSFIKRKRINIAHAHSSHAHGIAFLALSRLDECRLVVSRRVDFHINSFFSRKFKYGSSVDKIIAVSDAIRRILIEDGIDPRNVVTIRNGFIFEDFADNDAKENLRGELSITENSVVIATVAALALHKAHYILIKAAYNVIKKHPDTVFLLAGEGEMRSDIEKDIRSLGIEKNVILLGFVKDLARVYKTADIFAISSRKEGLCSSIFDAMYFNLPIVATSAGGIPEIVKNNLNGFIVPVDDYISFADRLNYLIENGEIREKMGSRSSSILKENTIKRTVDSTLDVYNEILGK